MAIVDYSTDNALTKKQWRLDTAEVFRKAANKEFFVVNGLKGKSNDNIIVEKDDFKKDAGDKVTRTFTKDVSSRGLTEAQINEQNIRGLINFTDYVELERAVELFGVPNKGTVSAQRTSLDIDTEIKTVAENWVADHRDTSTFLALSTSPTNMIYTSSGTLSSTSTLATAKSALTSSDLLTPKLINAARIHAKYKKMPAVSVGGKEYYVLIVSPEAYFDVAEDPVWQQAAREAEIKGKENPIFKGADYVMHGVIVMSHRKITTGSDAGSGAVRYAQNLLLGAQAGLWVNGFIDTMRPMSANLEEEIVYKPSFLYGVKKVKFNSEDLSTITLMTATTDLSLSSALAV